MGGGVQQEIVTYYGTSTTSTVVLQFESISVPCHISIRVYLGTMSALLDRRHHAGSLF